MASEFTGGCLCGSVRFTCTAEPALTAYCHCSDCQRAGGGPFSVNLMVSSESFSVQGESQSYTVVGGSGKEVHRYFCPNCGSSIYLQSDAAPGLVFLKAGALDDAGWVNPQMHIFTAAKQPWLHLEDSLPKYEGMPPQ